MPKGSKVKFLIGKTGSNESLASNESVLISSNESACNGDCVNSLPDSPDMIRSKKEQLTRYVKNLAFALDFKCVKLFLRSQQTVI
jgi:hypothetical protein